MKHHLTYLILIVLAFSSCRARFYTANRNPTPLFRESGDVYFDASTNLFNKYDFTAGAAVSNNIGAYVGYAGAGQSVGGDTLGNEQFVYRGSMLNIGAGYFLNKEQTNNFRFEIYADYGRGSFKNKVTGSNKFFNGDYQRLGVMPNIGYTAPDNQFSICYSIRLARIRFYNADVNPIGFWQDDINRYNYRPYYNLVDHALNMRFGGEKFKFQLQLAAYTALNADDLNTAVPSINMAAMFGLVYEMNLKNK